MGKAKKYLFLILALFGLSACGASDGENNEKETSSLEELSSAEIEGQVREEGGSKEEADSKEAIVVYFSATGHTKAVAEKISAFTGFNTYEILPKDPYTEEDLDYNNDSCRANLEQQDDQARPELAETDMDFSPYDLIFLGYPIWWGTSPKIINTFIETYDLADKTIMPFCTSGGSGIEKSVESLRSLLPDSDVRDGLRASDEDDPNIETWIVENGIKTR